MEESVVLQSTELKKDDIWSARISKVTKKKLLEQLEVLGLDAQSFLESALTHVRPSHEKPDPKLIGELSEADLLIGRLTSLLHAKISLAFETKKQAEEAQASLVQEENRILDVFAQKELDLREELSHQLESEKEQFQAQLQNTQEQKNDLLENIEDLKSKLEKREQEVKSLDHKLFETQKRIEPLEDLIELLKKEKYDLEFKITAQEELKQQLHNATKQIAQLYKDIENEKATQREMEVLYKERLAGQAREFALEKKALLERQALESERAVLEAQLKFQREQIAL